MCSECPAYIKVNSIRNWNTRVYLNGGYIDKDERITYYHGTHSE